MLVRSTKEIRTPIARSASMAQRFAVPGRAGLLVSICLFLFSVIGSACALTDLALNITGSPHRCEAGSGQGRIQLLRSPAEDPRTIFVAQARQTRLGLREEFRQRARRSRKMRAQSQP